MVGAGAALHRLVVVVADRVVQREVLEDRLVALRHVVVAHGHRALVDRRGWLGAVVVPGGVGHPGPQLAAGHGGLLPHLVEAVQWVTHEGAVELALPVVGVLDVAVGVGHVLGDLERAVGQGRREPPVGLVPVLAVAGRRHVRGVRLRQGLVAAGELRRQRVSLGVGGGGLRGLGVVRAGGACLGDDALGQQVPDLLVARRLVGREHVVEAVVLPDDHDDVLDRRGRGRGLAGTRRGAARGRCGHHDRDGGDSAGHHHRVHELPGHADSLSPLDGRVSCRSARYPGACGMPYRSVPSPECVKQDPR